MLCCDLVKTTVAENLEKALFFVVQAVSCCDFIRTKIEKKEDETIRKNATERLSVHLDWGYKNMHVAYDEIPKSEQNELYIRRTESRRHYRGIACYRWGEEFRG